MSVTKQAPLIKARIRVGGNQDPSGYASDHAQKSSGAEIGGEGGGGESKPSHLVLL